MQLLLQIVYRDLWQIFSAVTASAMVTVLTATTTEPSLDLSLLRGALFIGYAEL